MKLLFSCETCIEDRRWDSFGQVLQTVRWCWGWRESGYLENVLCWWWRWRVQGWVFGWYIVLAWVLIFLPQLNLNPVFFFFSPQALKDWISPLGRQKVMIIPVCVIQYNNIKSTVTNSILPHYPIIIRGTRFLFICIICIIYIYIYIYIYTHICIYLFGKSG